MLVQEWVDLYQRFWSCSKNSQLCIKNSRQSRRFLNLINYTLLLVLETAHNKKNNNPQGLLIIATHCFEEQQLLLLDMHLWCYHHNLSTLCPHTRPKITRNKSKQIFINISGIKTSLMLKMFTYSYAVDFIYNYEPACMMYMNAEQKNLLSRNDIWSVHLATLSPGTFWQVYLQVDLGLVQNSNFTWQP